MSDDRPMGQPAQYDPKDKATVHRAEKRGEWYRVEGESGGKKVSLEIHAKDVESRSTKDAHALFRRSILGQSNQERS